MASIPVRDRSGNEVGTYEVNPDDFAARISRQLLHDAVVMYQANSRQGSHKTKTRGEVSGSTRKLYRQKGTGNARMGTRRSGIRRGGGHIHAKQNRDYSYRLTKKALRSATRMAIASKIRDGEVDLIDELSFAAPKTKEMAAILANLGLTGQRLLVATPAYDQNVYKSARNIASVSVSPADEVNALSVLTARRLLLTRSAMDSLKVRFATSPAAAQE
jgi:large subunit ribosomal protein L4